MISAKEIPPEAILLAVYLELQNGMFLISDCQNTQTAILEKQCFIPFFLN